MSAFAVAIAGKADIVETTATAIYSLERPLQWDTRGKNPNDPGGMIQCPTLS